MIIQTCILPLGQFKRSKFLYELMSHVSMPHSGLCSWALWWALWDDCLPQPIFPRL